MSAPLILLIFQFQVHINLGAGETEVSSPSSLRLDDLAWHSVRLTRQDGDMSLVIDNVHTER